MKVCPTCQVQYSDEANFCPDDAARLTPVVAAAPDDSLTARFELAGRVGGGRTGDVFRARDTTSNAIVAVKTLHAHLMAWPQFASRAERELGQLQRINAPQVAQVVAHGKRLDGAIWYATEWVDNAQSLSHMMNQVGRMDVAEATRITVAIGEGFIEGAKAGVIHRDPAPKNVLVSQVGIKLINFVAPVLSASPAQAAGTHGIPGEPEFVAPEVFVGRPADQRSLIYSLAAIYFSLITGTPPFAGSASEIHAAHQQQKAPSLLQFVPVLPGLDAAVARALDANPSKRYLTIRQFLDELIRIIEGMATVPVRNTGAMNMTLPLGRASTASSPAAVGRRASDVVAVAASPAGVTGAGPVAGVAVTSPSPALSAPAVVAHANPAGYSAGAGGQTNETPIVLSAPTLPPSQPVVETERSGRNHNFRETLWFKKGALDAEAAAKAAQAAAKGQDVLAKSDNLDADQRYIDDGSITSSDRAKFSVRSSTNSISPQNRTRRGTDGTSADSIVGEMKSGRMKYVVIAVVGILALIAVLVLR